jgi:hypothetical protein
MDCAVYDGKVCSKYHYVTKQACVLCGNPFRVLEYLTLFLPRVTAF